MLAAAVLGFDALCTFWVFLLKKNPSNLFNKSFLLLLALALVGLEHSNSLLDLRNTKLKCQTIELKEVFRCLPCP